MYQKNSCTFSGSENEIKNIYELNKKLLNEDISKLEKFTFEELPIINQSTQDALKGLEQAANNIKGLMNVNLFEKTK